MTAPDAAAGLVRGVRLFNLGRYMTAHELWEALWHEAAEEDRAFFEALVQLAAGLHLRTRRGNPGKVDLLRLDVSRLLDEFGAYVAWVREIRRPHKLLDGRRIPRLRWT